MYDFVLTPVSGSASPLPVTSLQTQELAKVIFYFQVWWMVHTATGRLWEDHLGHLGYQSKSHWVQDTILTQNSDSITKFAAMVFKKTAKIMFLWRSYVSSKKTNRRRQCSGTRPSMSTHPNPIFKLNPITNQQYLEFCQNPDSINHPHFWVCSNRM